MTGRGRSEEERRLVEGGVEECSEEREAEKRGGEERSRERKRGGEVMGR